MMGLRLLVSYHSDYGNTEAMARAVAAGAAAALPDAAITLKRADETELDDLTAADAVIIGTPVHMGGVAWQVKRLIDRAAKLWMEGALEGKVGGVFASGGGFGGAGGGAELVMASLHANFLEHGMIVVGFPKSLPGFADGGIHWGAYARSGDRDGMPRQIDETQLAAARAYGAHVARAAARWMK